MENNYKEFAIDLAYKAGDIMCEGFISRREKKYKGDNSTSIKDIVTETDRAINRLVLEVIGKKYPDHDVLAEEESDMSHDSELVWVCDPLDGTAAFAHGIATSVFALALLRDGEPFLGVVYDPFQDRMFSAEKGKGAFLNDVQIHVSEDNTLKDKLIGGLNFWPLADYDTEYFFKAILAKGAQPLATRSLIFESMLVASGEIPAAMYIWKFPHDGAAVKIIVEEAGGKVTGIFGEEQRYDREINGYFATNGRVHSEIIETAKQTMKKREGSS